MLTVKDPGLGKGKAEEQGVRSEMIPGRGGASTKVMTDLEKTSKLRKYDAEGNLFGSVP